MHTRRSRCVADESLYYIYLGQKLVLQVSDLGRLTFRKSLQKKQTSNGF